MTKLSPNRSPKLLFLWLLCALLVTSAFSAQVTENIDGKLVKVAGSGELGTHIIIKEPPFYVFLFDASTSKSDMTPWLISRYKALKSKRPFDFEFVFVSQDVSAEEMKNHMVGDGMPWPALSYNQRSVVDDIKEFSGDGIPSLVVVTKEGQYIDGSYRNNGSGDYKGVKPVVETLEKLLGTDKDPKSKTVDEAVESAEDAANKVAGVFGVSKDRLMVASILAIMTFLYLFFRK